jgi:hypothetical protein
MTAAVRQVLRLDQLAHLGLHADPAWAGLGGSPKRLSDRELRPPGPESRFIIEPCFVNTLEVTMGSDAQDAIAVYDWYTTITNVLHET